MQGSKADIIAQLQKDILPLQGYKHGANSIAVDAGLGPVRDAFPNGLFPVSAVHEFICHGKEDAAATGGFILGILAALMKNAGAVLWVSSSRTIFPPALVFFGIAPEKIIFADLPNEKDVLWAVEEALKCDALSAVVGETSMLSFTASRRLQLAVEQSKVTGFILRNQVRNININTTACLTRWKITSLQSSFDNGLPGLGFPRWKIALLKVRNGRPGNWQLEWNERRFRDIMHVTPVLTIPQKKTG